MKKNDFEKSQNLISDRMSFLINNFMLGYQNYKPPYIFVQNQSTKMKSEFLKYANLRVYKSFSTLNLLNAMLCNRIMKQPILVNNSRRMYELSTKVFGKSFVNAILTATFCKVLTAGNSLQEANKVSDYFRQHNIPVILDYCAEGSLDDELGQGLLQSNTTLFAESAKSLFNQKNEMISIKITGMINMHTLKLLNDSVIMRDQFWQANQLEGKLNSQRFFNALQKIYAGVTEEQFGTYLRKIFNYQGDITQFEVDEVDFKMNHHPFYLYDTDKNDDFIIKLFSPFSQNQWEQLYSLLHRLNRILAPFADSPNGFRILVDAEQSYVQLAIECLSEQMQGKYNKEKVYIIPTIQNYLKRSVERTKYEVEIAKRKNLKFGAKLVRGAYIVEETRIATQNKVQNPIVGSFQKTTINYMNSFETIIKSFDDGEVIVATHNADTVEVAQKVHSESGSKIKVSFAQLLGLADHLTWKVNAEKFTVYKYLPWAKTQVMIAYMIRRAQELNQMRYPLDTQYELLRHELKSRLTN